MVSAERCIRRADGFLEGPVKPHLRKLPRPELGSHAAQGEGQGATTWVNNC